MPAPAVIPAAAPALRANPSPTTGPAPQPAAAAVPAADAETLDLEDMAEDEAEGALDLSALAAVEPNVTPAPAPLPPKVASKPVAPARKRAAPPKPRPKQVAKPKPKPVAKPKPKPRPKPVAKPKPKPVAKAPAPPPKKSAGGTGYVTIVCDPACDSVTVDGKNLGPSPVVRSAVSAGPQSVTLEAKGYKSKTISLKVEAGKTTARRVKLSP